MFVANVTEHPKSDYDQLNQLSGPESFDDVSNNDEIDGANSEDGRSQNRGWGNKVKGVLHHLGRNEIEDCCVSQVTLLIQVEIQRQPASKTKRG